jgi:hypothetical protein
MDVEMKNNREEISEKSVHILFCTDLLDRLERLLCLKH